MKYAKTQLQSHVQSRYKRNANHLSLQYIQINRINANHFESLNVN